MPPHAFLEQASVSRPNGKVRLDPKIKRLIVPGLWTDDVRPQLGHVALAKDGGVEISRSSEVFHVRAIAFKVPFHLVSARSCASRANNRRRSHAPAYSGTNLLV